MIALIFGRIAKWWATKHASNILLAVVLAIAGLHYANLRATAERCKAATEFQRQLKQLSEQITERRNEERDEANEQIDEADDPCLDANVADILQNPD